MELKKKGTLRKEQGALGEGISISGGRGPYLQL